ncbi:16S rRNA (guanine527-N7)-methyltransferase [Spiroplasma helicoides]|uniref:Ribosomal RNA small subunit methyltransferase G n=1 Tax=Spiroplasma helicoides TaxID=216938 RepID=A0A1B3SMB0_9MOLU|nr:16S rRNA (guanine(527)-N(7))-methyltransferase RsmG [Spiroplasma helicoides]AOG61073.1 16S rRNA (guanine527-N7)-methyltransferase [Spiroplasma helicoides]
MFNWKVIEDIVGPITEKQKKQLVDYKNLIQEENKKYNLTTIVLDEEIFWKHFYDSIIFSQDFKLSNQFILDIGTGAGFPGIVIKVLFPETIVTLVESNNKKIAFLNLVIKKLELNNITTSSQRAEQFSIDNKEKYDIVISRALAQLNILLELGVQALKINGHFICLKSKNAGTELSELNGKECAIGLKLVKQQNLEIDQLGERVNLFFEKVRSTSIDYPRPYPQIKKKPLGK